MAAGNILRHLAHQGTASIAAIAGAPKRPHTVIQFMAKMKSALIPGDQRPGGRDGAEAIMGIFLRRNVVRGGQSWA